MLNYFKMKFFDLENLRSCFTSQSVNVNFALKLSNKDKKLFNNSGLEIQSISKRLFVYLFVVKKLILDEDIWNYFIERFNFLIDKNSFVNIKHYGFLDNWKDYL